MTLPDLKPHPLKKELRAKKISQRRLALALGVSQTQVSLWLNGFSEMPGAVEAKIAPLVESQSEPPLEEAAVA